MTLHTQWLDEHVSKVADAFQTRLFQTGNAYRSWQMIYCESKPGTRGGIAVVPCDDSIPAGWMPDQGIFADGAGHLTRDQLRHRLAEATRRLPVLDPNEA